MTNFTNVKPHIDRGGSLPLKKKFDRSRALEDVMKIIKENKKIMEEVAKRFDENLYGSGGIAK